MLQDAPKKKRRNQNKVNSNMLRLLPTGESRNSLNSRLHTRTHRHKSLDNRTGNYSPRNEQKERKKRRLMRKCHEGNENACKKLKPKSHRQNSNLIRSLDRRSSINHQNLAKMSKKERKRLRKRQRRERRREKRRSGILRN